jgi:hypothetical protein
MDFRLPEFNKSRLFGGKKTQQPSDVPLKPITHNELMESDFATVNKTKKEVQEKEAKT